MAEAVAIVTFKNGQRRGMHRQHLDDPRFLSWVPVHAELTPACDEETARRIMAAVEKGKADG